MSENVPCTLKDAVSNENTNDDDTLIISAEIGGVHQEIIVTKEWWCNKMNP
jgi:hypothetical protein